MPPVFNVLIIGAGQIGAFYDTPKNLQVLTHAHGFSQVDGFNLLGFVDTDTDKAEQAARLWGGQAFLSIDDAFGQCASIDVVCLTTPTATHLDLLRSLATRPIRMVFAEKPLVQTLNDAHEIVRLYTERDIALAINFIRRFVPEFQALKAHIQSGLLGEFQSGVAYYGKGFLNNGSHHLDLINFLLGSFHCVGVTESLDDFWPHDPSLSFRLEADNPKKSPLLLKAVDARHYTLFEFDFLFEKGRLRMINDGQTLEYYTVEPHPHVSGYQSLTLARRVDTRIHQAMAFAAENLYHYLADGIALQCDASAAIQSLELYEETLYQANRYEKQGC